MRKELTLTLSSDWRTVECSAMTTNIKITDSAAVVAIPLGRVSEPEPEYLAGAGAGAVTLVRLRLRDQVL